MAESGEEETLSAFGPALPAGALWAPVAGTTTADLCTTLLNEGEVDATSFAEVQKSAHSILSRTAPPTGQSARRTGLIVGYVQSGKTLSMTTVAAVARDNGFRIVIVFSGITGLLLDQSRDRFKGHLQPGGRFQPLWHMLDSSDPAVLRRSTGELARLRAAWLNPNLPESRKQALFITVMKHHRHLDALAELLRSANLQGIPALIIDDEADQAGLNTAANAAQASSSTHRHIGIVRDQLPHHTYLQYTATPQAPLLISLIDMLSPEFAVVLEPGAAYRGGRAFFGQGSPQLAQAVGPSEIFRQGQPPASPPPGFQRSLAQFLVCVAAYYIEKRNPPWSMLVHPSQRKSDHGVYYRWTQSVLAEWARELQLPATDPDRQTLETNLLQAYNELHRTDKSLPAFSTVLAEIQNQVGQVIVTALNSENGDEVKWTNGYAHVLVGGEKLNRGFTVIGLTTTYMPRSAGGWNADTIQQRARFFGYKAAYINRCRVYLHPDVRRAYQNYVEHEDNVRQQLAAWGAKPLRDWKRAFFLDGSLRPTRGNVLSDPFYRVSGSDPWHIQNLPHVAVGAPNRAVATAFLAANSWGQYTGDRRHLSAIVSLAAVQSDLLVPWSVFGANDVRHLFALRVWVDSILQRTPGADACIILMSGALSPPNNVRARTTNNGVVQPMSGSGGTGPNAYLGDRAMIDPTRITVQIHRLDVTDDDSNLHSDLYSLAIHVPQTMSGVLVQPT